MIDQDYHHQHDDEHEHSEPLAEFRPDFRLTHIPQTLLLALIRLYQLTFSRLMPTEHLPLLPIVLALWL